MILLLMQVEEMRRGEVFSTFYTAIDVGFIIMHLVIFKGRKGQSLLVGWEGAFHYFGGGGEAFTA